MHRKITGFHVVQELTCTHAHEYRLLGAYFYFYIYFFGVIFMHVNLCMHILASIFQDGGNQFPVTRLPVLNSVNDLSQHTLLLSSLHRYWSQKVHIIHRRINGFFVAQKATRTHAHEYRLLGASVDDHLIAGHDNEKSTSTDPG